MSRRRIEDLLQECLAAYETGLSPEECLSAWPEERAALEPLLRSALSLRVALARSPSEQLRTRARESLLFAAGRDVRQALAFEPRPQFRMRTRARLLAAAGADVLERLRDVPPPRLAFWLNARRRFLETARVPPRAAGAGAMTLALRGGLAAGVLLLVMTAAGLSLFLSRGGPPSVNAELASLERDLLIVEQQAAGGVRVDPAVLIELSRRTASIAEKVSQDAPPPVAEKLPEIISRQREVVSQAAGAGAAPQLQQAQQQLQAAEERIRVFAARVETTSNAATPVPEGSAATEPTAAPPAATPATPAPTATPVTLAAGQIAYRPLPQDTTFGLAWAELYTLEFRVAVPADAEWRLVSPTFGSTGITQLETPRVRLDGPNGTIIFISVQTGEVLALINGEVLQLRAPGPDGKSIGVEELVLRTGGLAPAFSHLLETVSLKPAATATPSPTQSPSQ
jgi:hypothetical protein